MLNEVELAQAEAWKNNPDSDELGISDRLQRLLVESREALETEKTPGSRPKAGKRKSSSANCSGVRPCPFCVMLLLASQGLGERCQARTPWNQGGEQAEGEPNKAMVNQWALQAGRRGQPMAALDIQQAIGLAETKMGSRSRSIRRGHPEHAVAVQPPEQTRAIPDEVNEVVFAPNNWGRTLRKNRSDLTIRFSPSADGTDRSISGTSAITTTPATTGSWSLRS